MISPTLLQLVRCPECRGRLSDHTTAAICDRCGRRYGRPQHEYLDLRPETAFAETTRYTNPELHADARHETVSPPLLSAAIRNDMLRAFLAPRPGDRVVDLGCGSGRALVWNQDLGAYQAGIDVSPYFAREARAAIDLVVGDLRKLPLADGAFTKAFSLDVLEHLSRTSLTEVLREACRVLTPGGALFVYTHVRRNSPLALGLRAINLTARGLERIGLVDLRQERLRKSDHLNPLADIDEFRRVAQDAGFRVVRLRYYTPLVGGIVENLLVRVAEGILARRALRRLDRSSTDAAAASLKAARRAAKTRIAHRGPTYVALVALTKLMKLDVLLFGRIRSGPFFALLIRE